MVIKSAGDFSVVHLVYIGNIIPGELSMNGLESLQPQHCGFLGEKQIKRLSLATSPCLCYILLYFDCMCSCVQRSIGHTILCSVYYSSSSIGTRKTVPSSRASPIGNEWSNRSRSSRITRSSNVFPSINNRLENALIFIALYHTYNTNTLYTFYDGPRNHCAPLDSYELNTQHTFIYILYIL